MLLSNTIHGFGGGRLGNQLFQFGMLFSLKYKTGQEFYIQRDNKNNSYQFWNCFDISIAKLPSDGRSVRKIHYGCPYEYYPDLYNQPIGTIYGGYFQNIDYYKDCKKELINFCPAIN